MGVSGGSKDQDGQVEEGEAMTVKANIMNMPDLEGKHGFLVVRKDECPSVFWYYGLYDDEMRAESVAVEIGNGIVLEV